MAITDLISSLAPDTTLLKGRYGGQWSVIVAQSGPFAASGLEDLFS
ncbi:hypothetical protein ACMXZU_11830 [Corynebacterium striatum]